MRGLRATLATLAAAALPVVGVTVLAWHGRAVAAWLGAAEPWQVALTLIAAGSLLCGTALVPTHALSLAGGYALGAAAGPPVAWVGVLGATAVGYGVGRLAAGDRLADDLRRSPRWRRLADELLDGSLPRTAWLIALIRLSPLAPFAATNVALAALRVPAAGYLAGAAVGLAPRVLAVALFGAGLAELDWSRPHAPWLLVAGGVATVTAVVAVGRVAGRALRDG